MSKPHNINNTTINPIEIEGFTILSPFDGMSCGQQAIERLGIKHYTYFSSEVDKYAMQVTRHNYPNTIFLGSVTEITIEKYDNDRIIINNKYIINPQNLILIGGSPCQGFSFAGKQKGASAINRDTDEITHIEITTLEQYLKLKDQGFEFNGQSYLFWEYIRIKTEIEKHNPNLIFLLENVKMTQKWQGMFDEAVGGESVEINSSLVSAQNRRRLYWSNLQKEIEQPKDRKIYLKDILEDSLFVGKHLKDNYQGGNQLNPNYKSQANTIHDIEDKCFTLCAGTHGYANGYVPVLKGFKIKPNPSFSKDGLCHIADAEIKGNDAIKRLYFPLGKAPTLTTCGGGTENLKSFAAKSNQRSVPDNSKPIRLATIKDGGQGNRIYSTEAKGIALASQSGGTAGNGNMLIANPNQIPLCGAMRGRYLENGKRNDGPVGTSRAGLTKQYIEVRHDYKTNCLTTVQKDNNIVYIDIKDHNNKKVRYEIKDIDWRKLTPVECERLQTVADNYTSKGLDENFKEVKISNTQRYKMLGNGWTVEVIVHIFKNLDLIKLYKNTLLYNLRCRKTN